jgi:hypothetical protein
MRHHEGTHIAAGGALFGIGWGSILTLLIAAGATASKHPLTGDWWYFPAAALSLLFAGVGAWLFLGVYVPWFKLPQTVHGRLMASDLRLDRVTILQTTETIGGDWRIMFHVGFQNYGRGDVPNAIVQVLVPDFFRDFRYCDMFGRERDVGDLTNTSESLQADDAGAPIESRVWSATGLTLYGNAATPIYFLCFQKSLQPFRVRVSLTSSELSKPIDGIYDLDPRTESS